MILDAFATLADAQSGTTSVASTDIVDTVAAGDMLSGMWFYVRVDTAFTSGGQPKAQFALETSSTETFDAGTTQTLALSAEFLAIDLVAGRSWAVPVGPNTLRYIRGRKIVSGTSAANYFTAGAWDMALVKDIDVRQDARYALRNSI